MRIRKNLARLVAGLSLVFTPISARDIDISNVDEIPWLDYSPHQEQPNATKFWGRYE